MGIADSHCSTPLEDWLQLVNMEVTEADHQLIDTASELFECVNVHLLERQKQGVDPIVELEKLRSNMPSKRPALYAELLAIFANFGDRHSRCLLPKPWNDHFVFLPFTVGCFERSGSSVYMVTGSIDPRISKGHQLLSWNGEPIDAMLDRHMGVQHGANPAARFAKAVQTMTIRPLALLPPPPTGDVTLVTRSNSGDERQSTFRWRVADGIGLEKLFAELIPHYEGFEVVIPGLMQRKIEANGKQFGWIKAQSLRIPPDEFLPAFSASLESAPQDGLILDFRGCEEGFIPTGEKMLRCLTNKVVTALPFQFRITDWVRNVVASHSALSDWQAPVKQSVEACDTYSQTMPLTKPASLSEIQQIYAGPIVVLVDALTYSTAEMVAATMQDHNIAKIIGTDKQTGGGGGSPWHQDFMFRLSKAPLFRRRPEDPALQMAVLRCLRTGHHAGHLLEGSGITPDILHKLTQRDLLEGEPDLIECAIQSLVASHG